MRDPLLETSGEVVAFYEREYYCFSNFSSFSVEWRGRIWQTSEHAYQAAKFLEHNPELAEKIANAPSAHDAFKLAQAHAEEVPATFHETKVELMEDLCRHKLEQHPYIQKKLRETGTKQIIEDSPKDAFWGWGLNRDGRNELGKVWMRLRDELPLE